ncbi:MAG: myxococcus cysteine-rich repeat containing protein [Deltaproteobacteria bacterium]|nr:myxococcus cysteine-rich repeat containing protein [Deltaproteobacteria bacterium]
MTTRRLLLAIGCLLGLAAPLRADECASNFYPPGGTAFADSVLAYDPFFAGGPAPSDPKYVNPSQALGAPNFMPDAGGSGGEFNGTGAVAVGRRGLLSVRFTDNLIVNGTGNDFALCEVGTPEPYFLSVRPANATVRTLLQNAGFCLTNLRNPNDAFCDLAVAPTGRTSVDLDSAFPGFAAGELRFDAVQIVDNTPFNGGDQIGADIDAVGATQAGGFIACGDGRVEGNETCDDSNTMAGDGCSATCRTELCWQCSGEPSSCMVANGLPCDDGEPCTANDSCQATVCVGGPPPDCDDANVCTTDSCTLGVGCVHANNSLPCDDDSSCSSGDSCSGGVCRGNAVEASGCSVRPGKLRIVNRDDDSGDSLVWIWATGDEDFSSTHPSSGPGHYELCVFDAGPMSTRRLRIAGRADKGGICNDQICWKPSGATGYRYKNFAAPFGVRQLFLKSGTPDKAKILAKGRGVALDLPGDLDLAGTVRVQLKDSGSGACWESTFPTAQVSDEKRYKAKQ